MTNHSVVVMNDKLQGEMKQHCKVQFGLELYSYVFTFAIRDTFVQI